MAYPYVTKLLVDEVLIGHKPLLNQLVAISLALVIAGFFCSWANNLLYSRATMQVLADMREDLFCHILRLPMPLLYRQKTGELLTRLNMDMAEVQGFAVDSLYFVITNVIALVFNVAMLFWLNPPLAWLSLLLLPLPALSGALFRRTVGGLANQVRQGQGRLATVLLESLQGIKVIKGLAVEPTVSAAFRRDTDTVNRVNLQLLNVSFLAGNIPGTVVAVAGVAVYWWCGRDVLHSAISVGDLIAFSSYLVRAFSPIQGLTGVYIKGEKARVSWERVSELLDQPAEPSLPATLPEPLRGQIEFRNVSFAYPDVYSEKRILSSLTFTLPAGAVLAIVGPSGIGKTTILDLLLKHLTPTAGAIRLDGIPIAEIDAASLRRNIAYVSQDVWLIHGTVAENLTFGRACPMAEVEAMAKLADIHDVILQLPQGYATIIGEKGMQLSAGQRQRLAIARALLHQPKVIVLDEATSALDRDTEQGILENLRRRFPGVTLILVSHRPGLVSLADHFLEHTKGRWQFSARGWTAHAG